MIKPIKKINVSEEVFLQMKDLILDRIWKPGDKLPSEHEMCELFDVSRGTIRNSLQKLATLELIETRIGEGSFVKKPDNAVIFNRLVPTAYFEDDMEAVLEFRREIEAGTCAIAATKANESDIKELRLMLTDMENLQEELDKLYVADLKFHYKIAQISRNPLIIKTYEIMADVYSSHMKRIVNKMGGSYGMFYHKKIVDAIELGDVDNARKYMRKHINENEEFINNAIIKINSKTNSTKFKE